MRLRSWIERQRRLSSSSRPLRLERLEDRLTPVTQSFSFNTPVTIPGMGLGSPVPPGAPASIYPMTLPVAGLPGTITHLSLTLNAFSHAFASDVDVLLVGPRGQSLLLMSDAGAGFSVSGLNLTFDDAAGEVLPQNTALTSGTFLPTDYDNLDTHDAFPAPAPRPSPATGFGVFTGSDPNGDWRLFIIDDNAPTGNDVGSLGGYTLTVTTDDLPSFASNVPFDIPGVGTGSDVPPGAPASLYPSTINVQGLLGTITNVNVTLRGFSHAFPADVDVLLLGPAGQSVMLMSDAGEGFVVTDIDLSFADNAAAVLPQNAPLTPGTYVPTNHDTSGSHDGFPAPAPPPPFGDSLAVFNGTNPNGAWQLFIIDDKSGEVGSLDGWALNIQTTGGANWIDISDATVTEGDAGTLDAVFTVTITQTPTAPVAFSFATLPGTATIPADLVPLAGTLQFQPGTPTTREIRIRIIGERIDEDDETFSVVVTSVTGPAFLRDGTGAGLIVDNDTAGVSVTPAGTQTTEAGGTATFAVVLQSVPTADVIVTLATSDPSEGTPDVVTLTFTPLDALTPQTVTVTGVDDTMDDGDIAYAIGTNAVTSADLKYDGIDPADVPLTNIDDDTAGIVVTPISGLITTEAGGTATFTVVLTSTPLFDVIITLTSSDPSEGTLSTNAITFTPVDALIPRIVTIIGVDDTVDDGDVAYTIVTNAATSADPLYTGLDPADISSTNRDDDTAGIVVTPTTGLITTEAGGTATFTVVLTSTPLFDVILTLASGDPSEGTLSTNTLTFTPLDALIPRVVTITGADDTIDDGDIAYTIVTNAATSADLLYDGLDPADVSATNQDDDTAGIVVTPTSGLITTEAGGTATFTVVLTSTPLFDVIITLTSGDPSEGTLSTNTLTFTPLNALIPQTVTVTGVDDTVDDGDIGFTILTNGATSADPLYDGLDPADISATNRDDDTAGIVVTPTTGLITTEAGKSATFTVVLTSTPLFDVILTLTSGNPSEGTLSTTTLTFTPLDALTPQIVTILGADDTIDDGDIAYTILTNPSISNDTLYKALDPADVALTNLDDDTAGFVISPAATLVTSETGTLATFTIRLTSTPLASVTVSLTSSDATEGVPLTNSVTFTPSMLEATVIVAGVDDCALDGSVFYTLLTGAAISADPVYAGLDPADVPALNTDFGDRDILVFGSDAGVPPHVLVFDAITGVTLFSFYAYSPTYRGGVRVAAGDVTGDGVPDIITGSGISASHVKVFDGTNGAEIRSFLAFPGFGGGVFVAAGDLDGDRRAEVIVSAGPGAGPHVKAFDGQTNATVRSFFAYAPVFTGGVTVAAGDVTGDGRAEIVTAAVAGAAHIMVFDGPSTAVLASFLTLPGITGLAFVSAGDIDGDCRCELFVSGTNGANSSLSLHQGTGGLIQVHPTGEFTLPSVRVAMADHTGDGMTELYTSGGPGSPPQVVMREPTCLLVLDTMYVFAPIYTGGVFIG